MLNMNLTQPELLHHVTALEAREDDARLDLAVNALMMAMALENANLFAGVADVTPGFADLEHELADLQANELRAAYEGVQQAEIALGAGLATAEAEAQAEIESAHAEIATVELEVSRLRGETEGIENEFEPLYRQIAEEMEVEQRHAAELRAKASGLNAEARSQFENKVELVLKARVRPFEERCATLDAERVARRQPLEQQITTLEAQKRTCEEELERVTNGQSDAQERAAALRDGRADAGKALYVAVRELLAARERFGEHIERVEKGLDANGRIKEIAKRQSHFVERARLELDAPINAAGALERAKEGRIADAKRLLELALRGGLAGSEVHEIQQEIAHAEYVALVKAWEQDLLQRAPGLNGMNTVNHYKERVAQKALEDGYQRLPRDLARALSQAEKAAGQGVAARRRMLEAHAAQYINSQNKFFSAQIMPDSGRVMIAVKKNGQWLRHAHCTMVEQEGGYEIKTSYYERKTPLDDQNEWDNRRARLERRLPQLMTDQSDA